MSAKHTPGPWLNAGRSAGSHIHADNGEIAWLRSYMGVPDQEIEANALLISAAPELLNALNEARYELSFTASPELLRKIDAAIAKTKSGEE